MSNQLNCVHTFAAKSPAIRRRLAFTLHEILTATVIMAILMMGMSSAILFVNEAKDEQKNISAKSIDASEIVDRIIEDLAQAENFSERTSTTVAFTVPDRDKDGSPEAIRYAWSGVVGDPLTVEYNGSPPEAIAKEVHSFNVDYLLKTAID